MAEVEKHFRNKEMRKKLSPASCENKSSTVMFGKESKKMRKSLFHFGSFLL
jgi:hypothetical protein